MIKYLVGAIALFAIFTGMQSADAALVTYYLQNVTFTDGGVATGSVQLDTTTHVFGSFDIITTGSTNGNGFPGSDYNDATSGSNDDINQVLSFLQGESNLFLVTTTPLTDSGTFALAIGTDPSQDSNEITINADRLVSGGFLSTFVTAAPEPSGLSALLVASIGLFGMLSWKKMRTSGDKN